jgi:flavin reductase (DIM6/NTAB) family NADH-FMN oxidoreductase RutF
MDIPWGSEISNKFITNIGLITTTGPHGQDVMAAEWTHHVSYRPGLIAVSVGPSHATHENIAQTEEFGISICSTDQTVLSSISGGYSAREYDKISALQELGFEFYPAKTIKTLMVKGACANIECRLFKTIPLGDHTMFVGEATEGVSDATKEPLSYHAGKYWKMSMNLPKPSQQEREKIRSILEKYRRQEGRQH